MVHKYYWTLMLLWLAVVPASAQNLFDAEQLPYLFEDGYALAPGEEYCVTIDINEVSSGGLVAPGSVAGYIDTDNLPQSVSVEDLWSLATSYANIPTPDAEHVEICATGIDLGSLSDEVFDLLDDLSLSPANAAKLEVEVDQSTSYSLLILTDQVSGVTVPLFVEASWSSGGTGRRDAVAFDWNAFVWPDPPEVGEDVEIIVDVIPYTYRVTGYQVNDNVPTVTVLVTGECEAVGGFTVSLPDGSTVDLPTVYRYNLSFTAYCLENCGTNAGKTDVGMDSEYARYVFMEPTEEGQHLVASMEYEDQGNGTVSITEGSYYEPAATATAVEDPLEVPTELVIHGNYPNPFNGITTVRYDLHEPSYVQVRVYDVRGRLITTLSDSYQPAGHYAVQFDTLDLPSGTYLCRISTPSAAQTVTMTLLK